MGAVLSYFWEREDPQRDIPDPQTGLTQRERQAVVSTWAVVKLDAKRTGVELFMRLFEAHPEHQKRFPSFRGMNLTELRGSTKLSAHATNVMYSLTGVVDNLEDPECLTELLRKLGENHRRHEITEKEFHDLKVVLMDLLKEKLGEQLTPQGERAWNKTVDLAYTFIFQGLKKRETSNVTQQYASVA